MAQYNCPLCKQEVSKTLYEKITGVWQEKEQKLAALKKKEKELKEKEAKLKDKFESEKKTLLKKEQMKAKKEIAKQHKEFMVKIQKEKNDLKKKQDDLKKKFEKQLASETNKILKAQKADQKRVEKELKMKFELSSKNIIEKEKKKIEKEKSTFNKEKNKQMDRYNKLNKQFVSLQSKSTIQLEKADKKIKLLEEQIKKNQTPQVLGLLEEGIFLEKLKKMFPRDEFKHTGKGGDIVHYVREKDKEVGVIVYELKKVGNFSSNTLIRLLEQGNNAMLIMQCLLLTLEELKMILGFQYPKVLLLFIPPELLY